MGLWLLEKGCWDLLGSGMRNGKMQGVSLTFPTLIRKLLGLTEEMVNLGLG